MPCVDRARGLTLAELLILIGIVVVIVAIAVPGLLSSQRASNERNASTCLKTLTSAEADFRANDRDGNHVNDFWTADVKGLYTMTSAAEPGAAKSAKDPCVKLIELAMAAADADPTFYPAGGENAPLTAFPRAKSEYWYVALLTDLSLAGKAEMTYKVDTGGTPPMGAVHNTSRFGFAAFPDSSSGGKYVFRVNENNTIFREATSGSVRSGSAIPPGLNGVPQKFLHFPSDETLKSYWSVID